MLISLVSDWLRDGKLVIVYVKGRLGALQDNARHIFRSVGSQGYWFPVCSCLAAPRVHSKGLTLTNIPALRKEYAECAKQGSQGKVGDKSWHSWISSSIVRRVSRVIRSCRVPHEEGHRYNQAFSGSTPCMQPMQGACARSHGLLSMAVAVEDAVSLQRPPWNQTGR